MNKNYPVLSFRFLSTLLLVLVANFLQAQTTTWNGSVWDNGTPDITKDAVFTGNFVSSANLVTKSISVSNAAQVSVLGPYTLTVANNIDVVTGSKLIFENNASLLQTNASAINTGSINFKRNTTPMVIYEYTYWSSPVTPQTLVNLSPLTLSDKYFSFNTSVNDWVYENANNTMQKGKGYAIRAPQGYTSTPQIYNGEFIGTPNNGNVSSGVIAYIPADLNYNLLGNPYPSAISVASLIDNSTLGTLYFWTHNSAINSNNGFTTADYAIRTRNSGIAAISGGSIPSAYIAAGQGFFASSSTTGNVVFTNAMRVSGNNSQFFKNTQQDPDFYYMWLNMTNVGGAFKQLSIGYEQGATNGYDFGIDAAPSPGTYINFYSMIGTGTYAIQGRAYPWTSTDEIPIGYSSTLADDFTIAIDHVDTFFDTQDIFIEDLNLGIYHNLKTSPYTFTTAIGTFNNRFKIVYTDPTLSNPSLTIDTNSVFVHANTTEIIVNSTSQKIKNIQVYDVLGRLIFTKEKVNENKIIINTVVAQNQTLIIKTQLENDQIVSKKLIF